MAAREIGGYLELERFGGPMLHEGDVALNCGRSCLEYLIELRDMRRVWLPDFLCASVLGVCAKVGVPVSTYLIGEDLLPTYDFEIGEGEWLYLVDYYGQLTQSDVDDALARSHGRLVVDESQAYFRGPWEGADTLWTCRKWLGVADGAFLHTSDGARLARELPRSESYDKMDFVLGRFERPAGEFFAESKANNKRFTDERMSSMSALTENILRAVNYESVRRARLANWDWLDTGLGESNLLHPRRPDAPFMYPHLVADAAGVRQRMAAEGVFVPTLWPDALEACPEGTVANDYSANILPLPIDQRYGTEDMDRVLEVLRRCLN